MSQKELFDKLGAPLVNARWSWGAVNARDGAVFLRVWQDETQRIDGRLFMRITANDYFPNNDPTNLGWQERLRHVGLVRAGALSFMIMCVARDVNATPREVQSFNRSEVFRGGQLIDADGDAWLELRERVRVQDVHP
jgi:hypothetical protein